MAVSNKDAGFLLTWKIKNFSLFHQIGEEYLLSPLFRIEMLGNSEWELSLFLSKYDDNELSLCRVQGDAGPLTVAVNVKISILENNHTSFFTEENSATFGRGKDMSFKVPKQKVFSEKHHFLPDDTLVVQCRLWNKTTKNLVKCFTVTEISVEKYNFSLPVYYFSDTFLSTCEMLLKSVSKKYPDFRIYWTNQNENIDFKIHITEANFEVFLRCEISLQDLNCSKITLFEGCHLFETGTENEVWTLSNIFQAVIPDMKRSKGKSYKMDINFFASDSSQNSFTESISYCSTMPELDGIFQASSEYVMPKQLEKLYLDEKFSDFTIKSGKKEFKVHRNLFAAVSPVFCAMFELNMTEKKDSTVTIVDIELDTLEKLIHYIYTGNVADVKWDDALKLYAAADKYQIMDLRNSSARILIAYIDEENVIDALSLADLHQDKMVRNAAIQVVSENAQKVSRSKKWKSFMKSNPKLACEIMYKIWIDSIQFS